MLKISATFEKWWYNIDTSKGKKQKVGKRGKNYGRKNI